MVIEVVRVILDIPVSRDTLVSRDILVSKDILDSKVSRDLLVSKDFRDILVTLVSKDFREGDSKDTLVSKDSLDFKVSKVDPEVLEVLHLNLLLIYLLLHLVTPEPVKLFLIILLLQALLICI